MRNTLHVFTAVLQIAALAYAGYLIWYGIDLSYTNTRAFIFYDGFLQALIYAMIANALSIVHFILPRVLQTHYIATIDTDKLSQEPVVRDDAYYANLRQNFQAMYGPRS